MNEPEPELTASEIKAIMETQAEMIQTIPPTAFLEHEKFIAHLEALAMNEFIYPFNADPRPWEMFFAE